MALSNRQRAGRMPRARQRFTQAERVVLKELEKGDRTLTDLVEEYCSGRYDGGPMTAKVTIRQLIYRLRKKGLSISHHAVYRLEGEEP